LASLEAGKKESNTPSSEALFDPFNLHLKKRFAANMEQVDLNAQRNALKEKRKFAHAVAVGQLLAFNMGYLNGCCMSGIINNKPQPVSGFTAPYTNLALALGRGNIPRFGTQISMVLCFIGGSFITGIITPMELPTG